MEFSNTLKRAIESVGVNQTDIAQAIGVSQPLLGRYLHGKMLPKDETLVLLVKWFDERTEVGQSEWGTRLANAWTRSRLGGELADRVLASRSDITMNDSPDMFEDVSEEFKTAIKFLVRKGRRQKEIRLAIESLAAAFYPVSQDRSKR